GGGARLAEMSFAGVSNRFPFVLALPQSRTEAVLEERVRQLDAGALHRGVRVIRLRHEGGRVTAEANTGGAATRHSAALVVAADGVRSAVRSQLGTAVRAKNYPDSYLMGDFADSTRFGPDAALFLESAGIVESFPLPGGRRRWVVRLADPGTGGNARWLANRIGERTGIDVDPASNSMLSSFGVRARLARSMVNGRTVLIGDAAHEISPIGGQGMNLGWLDAVALAPVILASLRGADVGADLRNFETRRMAAAARAARQSEINMLLGRPLPAGPWSVRNRAIAAAAAMPAVNGFVARRFTMQ
ncbi:FAD-dependent oxidoreductase, partial [Arthrobacter sp. SO3]|uniref:FAD-dependent oxidoreductase n=1 Tax=Arthrobacter sp. SO3 TaxID=1897057 RepID=UPI001CFF62E1